MVLFTTESADASPARARSKTSRTLTPLWPYDASRARVDTVSSIGRPRYCSG